MSAEVRAALPPPEELARALSRDLRWLASELGSAVAAAHPVSPLRGVDRPRTAFRVDLADGRRVKLRRMKTPERAAELARLLERLADRGLPRPLLRRDAALVVEWIEGAPLASDPVPLADLREAARLLAAIHAVASFDGERLPAARSAGAELCALREQLDVLVDAGALAAGEAEALAARAEARWPARAVRGVAHGDFSGENLVVDARGRIRVVDNEALHVGPLDLDLARTWSRWALPDAAWRAFLAAYASEASRDVDEAALEIWKLRSLVQSAWYRTRYELPGVDAAVTRLRALRAARRSDAQRD